MSYEIGPCCLVTKYLHTDGELRPSHKCAICNEIVHMLWAVIDPNPDACTCKKCDSREDDSSHIEADNVSLMGSEKDKSVIENMTVSVDQMNEEFTTITESVKEKSVK